MPFYLALGLLGVLWLSVYWVHSSAEGRKFSDVRTAPECRVALVLGAKVYPSGNLSSVLKFRVNTAIELYKAGKVDKLLMSGDNRFSRYNEPQRMADYAILQCVPKSDVAMDFAGRRTYDSVYRAKHIFGLNRILVVTQGFHLDQTLFLCKKIGLEAYGVEAPMLSGAKWYMREYPACVSAILDAYILRPKPVMGKKEEI